MNAARNKIDIEPLSQEPQDEQLSQKLASNDPGQRSAEIPRAVEWELTSSSSKHQQDQEKQRIQEIERETNH